MILAEGGVSAAAGPLGLLVIVLIGVATALLIRNMNGRLRRLPREFPDSRRQPEPDAAEPPDRQSTTE